MGGKSACGARISWPCCPSEVLPANSDCPEASGEYFLSATAGTPIVPVQKVKTPQGTPAWHGCVNQEQARGETTNVCTRPSFSGKGKQRRFREPHTSQQRRDLGEHPQRGRVAGENHPTPGPPACAAALLLFSGSNRGVPAGPGMGPAWQRGRPCCWGCCWRPTAPGAQVRPGAPRAPLPSAGLPGGGGRLLEGCRAPFPGAEMFLRLFGKEVPALGGLGWGEMRFPEGVLERNGMGEAAGGAFWGGV